MRYTFTALSILVLGLSCNNNSNTSTNTIERINDTASFEGYKQKIQGTWRWKDDTSFHFVITGSKSFFISNASQVADTHEIRYLNENCNPKAQYDEAARLLIKGAPVYVNTWKYENGKPYKKRCFAVIAAKSNSLQLMDTEKGSLIEYVR